jgi:hypothetical protein
LITAARVGVKLLQHRIRQTLPYSFQNGWTERAMAPRKAGAE